MSSFQQKVIKHKIGLLNIAAVETGGVDAKETLKDRNRGKYKAK